MKYNNRRSALKRIGLGVASGIASSFALPSDIDNIKTILRPDIKGLAGEKKITAITLGAGNRGNKYGNYATAYPDDLDIVGVAEPNTIRNKRYCEKHNIAAENSFSTWEEVFERPKFADSIIITTPDDLHYGPAMAALKMGYHLLLEKPISPSEAECHDIRNLANEQGKVVAVCHVLRYAPYFQKLKEIVSAGTLGELISIQHFEPIEHIHMAHSYVRGNWYDSKRTSPIIIAKSCHDLDILRWLVDRPCEYITAFGDLKWFRAENKPVGATPRCTDGCAVESQCPYSAIKIYSRNRARTYVFDLPDDPSDHGDYIMEQLRTSNYGRCVYQMDNDQADHYVATMRFTDGVTASFSMEAFTSYHGRRTRIMGAMGDIVGDMESFVHTDFLTGQKTKWVATKDRSGVYLSGHGGGDWRLVQDWIRAVSHDDPSMLTSTIDASIESHIMGFRAEASRANLTVERVS